MTPAPAPSHPSTLGAGILAGILSLAACRPAPPPAPLPLTPTLPPAAPAATATVTPLSLTPPPPPPVALPPSVSRLENSACAWTTERWPNTAVAHFRFRPDGPIFARVVGGRAQVQIPEGPHPHAFADVGSNGLVVAGYFARAELTLFAAAPFALNGVVYPTSRARLSWLEGFPGAVSITTALPTKLVPTRLPVSAKCQCSDLSLDRGAPLDLPRAASGTRRGAPMILRASPAIALFSDPTRPADLKLVFGANVAVDSFTTLGAFSRIGVFVDDFYVAGWVKTALLQPRSPNGGSSSPLSTLGVGIGQGAPTPLARVACAADVPLVAEVAGERATIGVALAQTPIDLIDRAEPFSRVAIRNRNILAAPGIRFLARASDLAPCAALPP